VVPLYARVVTSNSGRIPTRSATLLSIIVSAYIAAQLLADVASLKLALVGGRAIDGGTLIYPLTFTLRDLIHKVAGKRVARTMIFVAAVANLFMALLFWVVDQLPVVPDSGLQSELFGAVLGPVWRIVFASIIAEVISELIDTEAYSAWVARFQHRHQWGRVLFSNLIAIPIDSIIFAVIAFAGVVPGNVVTEIIATNIGVKVGVTVLSIPLIYLIKPDPLVEDEIVEALPSGGPTDTA
jgi:uncharacterized integral membrane protein (TIGR00697 family)